MFLQYISCMLLHTYIYTVICFKELCNFSFIDGFILYNIRENYFKTFLSIKNLYEREEMIY